MQNISALFGPWIIGFYALLFLLTALLYRAVPGARKRLGGTALMALFSIAGILTARVMGGSAAGHLSKLIEVAARMLAMAAAINAVGVLGFSLVMPKLRTRVSKFVEDLILAAEKRLASCGATACHSASQAPGRMAAGLAPAIERIKRDGRLVFEEGAVFDDALKGAKNISIVACGTAYHAGLIGEYLIEKFARIPVEVDVSSEFRYRSPILDRRTLFIAVSQSGETADTLAALREAKKNGVKTVSICNVVGSTIARESDGVIYTHAGPEIGVASTKAYTAQITIFILLALYLGGIKGSVTRKQLKEALTGFEMIPEYMDEILDEAETIKACAKKYYRLPCFMYIGRGVNYPNAFEGALKLKEISYIHAEGYGAGEMKHGPIALIDRNMAVVAIVPQSFTYEKMISNMQEIRARNGAIIAIATEGDLSIKKHARSVLYIPKTEEIFSPLLTIVPLQLLAYYIAVLKGRDVDQPRNLAKSVTVE